MLAGYRIRVVLADVSRIRNPLGTPPCTLHSRVRCLFDPEVVQSVSQPPTMVSSVERWAPLNPRQSELGGPQWFACSHSMAGSECESAKCGSTQEVGLPHGIRKAHETCHEGRPCRVLC